MGTEDGLRHPTFLNTKRGLLVPFPRLGLEDIPVLIQWKAREDFESPHSKSAVDPVFADPQEIGRRRTMDITVPVVEDISIWKAVAQPEEAQSSVLVLDDYCIAEFDHCYCVFEWGVFTGTAPRGRT